MMSDQPLIEAFVQKVVTNESPVGIENFKFFVLPRIGEIIHCMDGNEEIALRIVDVDHWAHGPTDQLPYVVTLTGEQID